MKIANFLICFLAASGGIFSLPCSGFAHLLSANGASDFYYAFSESALTLRNDNFSYPRSFAGSVESSFETRLPLFQKGALSTHYLPGHSERNLIIFRPQQKGINYKRASIIGMVNAGAIILGFREAVGSW